MTVQGGRIKLGKNEDLIVSGIQAIADRDIDKAVFTCQGHRRFAAIPGQGV